MKLKLHLLLSTKTTHLKVFVTREVDSFLRIGFWKNGQQRGGGGGKRCDGGERFVRDGRDKLNTME